MALPRRFPAPRAIIWSPRCAGKSTVMFAVTDDQLRTIASRLLSQTAVSTASPTTSRRRHPHPSRDSNQHSKGDGADPNRRHNHHRSRHPNRHSTNPHHNHHPNHNLHPKP
jgi:hypothetical protein